MTSLLIEGHPLLDKSQSIAEAERVTRWLEAEAALGPDLTQVRQQGWMVQMGRWVRRGAAGVTNERRRSHVP